MLESVATLHRVRGLLARERAGEIGLDFLLRLTAILIAELHTDPGVRLPWLPWAPFGVTQMTRPATGSFSSSPMRLSSMKTSSPRR